MYFTEGANLLMVTRWRMERFRAEVITGEWVWICEEDLVLQQNGDYEWLSVKGTYADYETTRFGKFQTVIGPF